MRATTVAASLTYPIVEIPSGDVTLEAELHVPPETRGLILLASGREGSRHDACEQQLAAHLEQARFATLAPDLLTDAETANDEPTGSMRFDIPLLTQRLLAVRDWAARDWSTHDLPVGYFGTGTRAAATIAAAAKHPRGIFAIVSAGGRPDLAWDLLPKVSAAMLLIVGSCDPVVVELNRQALQRLACPADIRILEGAGRWFEAPGALDEMATLATEWFLRHAVT